MRELLKPKFCVFRTFLPYNDSLKVWQAWHSFYYFLWKIQTAVSFWETLSLRALWYGQFWICNGGKIQIFYEDLWSLIKINWGIKSGRKILIYNIQVTKNLDGTNHTDVISKISEIWQSLVCHLKIASALNGYISSWSAANPLHI